jgi:hypothetical protein
MKLFTRLFMIMAVAVFAASPVMACCITEYAQPGAATIQTEAPPCHGDMESESAAPMADDAPADCRSLNGT